MFGISLLILRFLDKWASCFYRLFKAISKEADKRFVKYNIQSTINGFIAKLNSDVPNLDAQRINIDWIEEELTPESFLKSGTLVLRMHKVLTRTEISSMPHIHSFLARY